MPNFIYDVLSVQFSLSHVQLFATPWTAACQASLSVINSLSLLKLMSIELVMPFNHLILCCPPLLPPSIFASSGSFPMSQFFASGGQSIGVSASTSVLPMNTQDRSPLGWTGWISSRVFPNTTVQKHQFFCAQHINCIFLFSGIWGSQEGCPMDEEVLESPPLCGQGFKVTT